MSLVIDDADFQLFQGDALETLRELPSESVHCCVCSPPYWGLRDYQTGSWEGGDPEHEHETVAARRGRGGSGSPGKQTAGAFPSAFAADECSCGARRVDQQLGLESTPEAYVARMVEVFREVRRVLRSDGTLWLNIGDSYTQGHGGSTTEGNYTPRKSARDTTIREHGYGGHTVQGMKNVIAGLKPKDLVGMPWRLAFALQADGWYLRSDIIWSKPNPMPESVTDRPTKAHEYVFLLSKGPRYYWDADAIREPASWARWGDQTVPKHGGTDTGAGWIKSRPKSELQRPQARRAMELFEQAGLTDAHAEAIRAVGITDAGKAQHTQDGYGKNEPEVQRLADEAKAALGGYYREFLVPNGRNVRSVWEIATEPYPDAHFATFPQKLVERCVKAGTSERGCCPVCGKPWERETERTRTLDGKAGPAGGWEQDEAGRLGPQGVGHWRFATEVETLGWRPGCDCEKTGPAQGPLGNRANERSSEGLGGEVDTGGASTIPCTILDPFLGSGTTAFVARKHGRRCVGIELSPEYCELIRQRTQQLSLLT